MVFFETIRKYYPNVPFELRKHGSVRPITTLSVKQLKCVPLKEEKKKKTSLYNLIQKNTTP